MIYITLVRYLISSLEVISKRFFYIRICRLRPLPYIRYGLEYISMPYQFISIYNFIWRLK